MKIKLEWGLSTLVLLTFWGPIILCCNSMHCRMLSNMSDLYPQDASTVHTRSPPIHHSCNNLNVCRLCQMSFFWSLGTKITPIPWLRMTELNGLYKRHYLYMKHILIIYYMLDIVAKSNKVRFTPSNGLQPSRGDR